MARLGFIIGLLFLSVARVCPAEDEPALPGKGKVLKVLPASDSSGFNIAGPLQNALGVLFQELDWYSVTLTSYSLAGFTETELSHAHELLSADLLGFVYLEKDRIAVFLFDSSHQGHFIVDSQSLVLPPGTSLNNAWVEDRLRLAFKHVISAFRRGQFQSLPGSAVDNQKLAAEENEDARARSDEARKFFRELSAMQERPYYLGGSIGMVRIGAEGTNQSSVNIGAYTGYRINENFRLEGGLDIFAQLGLHFDAAYRFPINKKYVSVWAGLGFERILGDVSQNLTDNITGVSEGLRKGQTLFGPELELHIPLLGTEIRAGLKYYLGGGSLLIAAYGFDFFL